MYYLLRVTLKKTDDQHIEIAYRLFVAENLRKANYNFVLKDWQSLFNLTYST